MLINSKLLTSTLVDFTDQEGNNVKFWRCLVQIESGEVFQLISRKEPVEEWKKSVKLNFTANKDLKPSLSFA